MHESKLYTLRLAYTTIASTKNKSTYDVRGYLIVPTQQLCKVVSVYYE